MGSATCRHSYPTCGKPLFPASIPDPRKLRRRVDGVHRAPVLFLTINPATFMEPENLMFCWKVVLHKNNDVLELHLCALETFSFAESLFVRRLQWNDEWRKGELTRLGNDWSRGSLPDGLITFIFSIQENDTNKSVIQLHKRMTLEGDEWWGRGNWQGWEMIGRGEAYQMDW